MFLMNGFSDKVKQKLGYYVYALADPRDNKIFYIGKGINNRIFQHEEKLDNSNKSNRIKEILSSGNKIKKLIISYGLSEKEAFVAESALINIMNYIDTQSLTNVEFLDTTQHLLLQLKILKKFTVPKFFQKKIFSAIF